MKTCPDIIRGVRTGIEPKHLITRTCLSLIWDSKKDGSGGTVRGLDKLQGNLFSHYFNMRGLLLLTFTLLGWNAQHFIIFCQLWEDISVSENCYFPCGEKYALSCSSILASYLKVTDKDICVSPQGKEIKHFSYVACNSLFWQHKSILSE